MTDSTPTIEPITPEAKAAMRAYLQRSEVRLSTMHRVAGIFLNGAGLLFLFPVMFKDAVRELANVLIGFAHGNLLGPALLLLVPFAISMAIPIYALWSLIKDLVYFYLLGIFLFHRLSSRFSHQSVSPALFISRHCAFHR